MSLDVYGHSKVTIRPGFPGTVPIFNLKSREKSQVSRDAHLSRFWPGVPNLSRLDKLLRLPEFNSSCLLTIVHSPYSMHARFALVVAFATIRMLMLEK